MYKRFACVLFAVGLTMLLAVPAMAAEDGTIRITPHRAGEAIAGGSVTIYRVGTAAEDGYLIAGKDKNYLLPADELFFPETAAWVQRNAKADGLTKAVGTSGSVTFSDLQAGLYLVTQPQAASGYAPFRSFLLELPVDGIVWEAEAYPKAEKILSENPQTGDHPAPIIAAMALVLSVSVLFMMSDKGKK